ncbi:MAG: tetratricopeptide repeat-containing sulfotransferase family protein [Candidatus Sericytochromatia bacterium]
MADFSPALAALAAAHRRARPPSLALLAELGQALLQGGHTEAAEATLQRLLARHPDEGVGHALLAQLHQQLGEIEPALNHCRQALTQIPSSPLLQNQLERLQQLWGEGPVPTDFTQLMVRLRALEQAGDWERAATLLHNWPVPPAEYPPVLAVAYARMCLRQGRAQSALAPLAAVLTTPHLPAIARRALFFALGDLYHQLQDPQQALAAYRQGHALARQDFDPARCQAESAALRDCFDETLLNTLRARGVGHPSRQPVFIVGMPRSGTTLTEQILSAHPQVYGGGEQPFMALLWRRLLGEGMPVAAQPMRERLLSLPTQAYHQAAEAYLDQLATLGGPDMPYITDKMPANFRHIGLIRLLFPQAVIIHCQRDAWATCFSCYSHNFRDLAYSHQLTDLGGYYQTYHRLMQHWQALGCELLPIDYADTVSDLATTCQRLLAALELDWHPDCLRFEQQQRRVMSASREQVRRPLYTHSLQRHLPYLADLAPLKPFLAGGESSQ